MQCLSNAHWAFDERGSGCCCIFGESGDEFDKPVKKVLRDQGR